MSQFRGASDDPQSFEQHHRLGTAAHRAHQGIPRNASPHGPVLKRLFINRVRQFGHCLIGGLAEPGSLESMDYFFLGVLHDDLPSRNTSILESDQPNWHGDAPALR